MTIPLFRDDAYLRDCRAVVVEADDMGVELDRSVFYPSAGGQPGDTGWLVVGGERLAVTDTQKGAGPDTIRHLLGRPTGLTAGMEVHAVLDWERRHRLMRMHTCLHLLCRAVDGVVTGGQIGDGKGRLDFDLPEAPDKEALAELLNAWIAEDRPVSERWIDADELDARPELVRTLSVKPPRGDGRVRLVEIEGVDLQACGGTHVRRTGEIGPVRIGKIEKKGRQNRRVQVVLGDAGDAGG
ncbi:MAG TPA: alanyl-tRNA editing protein [Geminicoccaceae bacterium]|jgi:misacylated tRNA(Ala) deacylase|nr:alanyl-tRNA editing protein [Geminicoccaceae bacterium]